MSLEYNTTRNHLKMPEYGRNVQKMIRYAISTEDSERRLKVAHVVVNIMSQMHPRLRDEADYKQKLWDHLYIISDWKLDVDGPYPPPSREALAAKPDKVPYSVENIKFKPYGKNIERIIDEAIELEEGPEKDVLMKLIANHLKKSYLNWNRDSVNDELIFKHFTELSEGKLTLEEGFKLNETNDILAKNPKKKKFVGKRDNNYHHKNKNRKYKQQ
jgi:hypothetical protein